MKCLFGLKQEQQQAEQQWMQRQPYIECGGELLQRGETKRGLRLTMGEGNSGAPRLKPGKVEGAHSPTSGGPDVQRLDCTHWIEFLHLANVIICNIIPAVPAEHTMAACRNAAALCSAVQ